MVKTTIKAPRLSPKNNSTLSPVSIAPIAPSVIKLLTAVIT
jgi:hypothetical protein